MKDIFKQIRDERQDFLNNEIEVVPGYNFSQYKTIKKIHLYYNSHYEKSDYEEVNGVMRKKVFHNLSRWRCEVASKMIDMDVKDFILVSNNNETDWNVFILEKELKVWMKKSKLGKLLNEISRLLPIYGTVILEKTKDGARIVDLRNFYVDQAASALEDARYLVQRSLLNHQDMRKMARKGWDRKAVTEAIHKFSGKYRTGYDLDGVNTVSNGSNLFYEGAGTQEVSQAVTAPLVEVYTRFGEVPLSWFTDKESDEDEYVLARYIVAGIDQPIVSDNDNKLIIGEEGVVLYKEQIDELPFKEVHYSRTEGRFLGIGIVEMLFENQRRMNKVKNHEDWGIELGSVQAFQTRSDTVQSNITTDMQPGEIIKSRDPIEPIATEMRNSQQLSVIAKDIDDHSDALTFSRDVVSGESMPSSATLGAVQIQTAQTTAVFDYKKENIDMFMNEFIHDLVFPEIERDLNKKHVFRLAGSIDELRKLRENYATNWANMKLVEHALHGDHTDPASPDLDMDYFNQLKEKALKDIAEMGDKIWVEVQERFFENLDYEVDIVSTGENKNVYAQINNGNALLLALSKDPTMLQDPVKKKILFKVMSAMGWHISELEGMESESLKQVTPDQANQQMLPKSNGGEFGVNSGSMSLQSMQIGQPA